jgi:hypothetical protein
MYPSLEPFALVRSNITLLSTCLGEPLSLVSQKWNVSWRVRVARVAANLFQLVDFDAFRAGDSFVWESISALRGQIQGANDCLLPKAFGDLDVLTFNLIVTSRW